MASVQKVVGAITQLVFGKDQKASATKNKRPSKVTEARPERSKSARSESKVSSDQKELSSLTKLELHLNNLSQKGEVAVAGKVQVLVLDELRNRLKSDWDRLSDRVKFIVESAIKKHIGAKDMFCPYGELGYLLVFANLTEDQATLKCVLIREEIFKVLFGNSDSDDVVSSGVFKQEFVQIITAVTSVSNEIELRPLEDVDGLFNRLQKASENSEPKRKKPDQDMVLSEDQGSAKDKDNKWVEETDEGADDTDDTESQQTSSKKADAKLANWKTDQVSEEVILKPLQGLEYVYRPLWNTGSKKVSYLVALPSRKLPSGRLAVGYEAVGRGINEGTYDSLDLEVLSNGLKMTTYLGSLGAGAKLIIPVHFQTLASAHYRGDYKAACSKIPKHQQKDLVFEIIGISRGIPRSRLQELVMGIQQYGDAVVIRMEIENPEFSELKHIGVNLVGFSLDEKTVNDEQALNLIGNFVNAASSVGLQVYAAGIPSKNISTMAIGLGVSLIGSPFVSSAADIPVQFKEYNVANLFGHNVY